MRGIFFLYVWKVEVNCSWRAHMFSSRPFSIILVFHFILLFQDGQKNLLTCSPAPGHWGPSPALPSPQFPWRWGSGRGCGAGWEESLGSETGSSAGSTCARHRCRQTHAPTHTRTHGRTHTQEMKERKSVSEWTCKTQAQKKRGTPNMSVSNWWQTDQSEASEDFR